MAAARLLSTITVEEYLKSEKSSPVKREYVGGRLYALAGASDEHNRIAGRIFAHLLPIAEALGCRPYISDMKLRVAEDVFYYPDVMVVCEDDPDRYFKTRPCVLVEVTSISTATTDRREKLDAYLRLPSLSDYLVVEAEEPQVTAYSRTPEGWLERTWEESGKVPIACLSTEIDLEELYRGL